MKHMSINSNYHYALWLQSLIAVRTGKASTWSQGYRPRYLSALR